MKEIVMFFLNGKRYGIDVSNLLGIERYSAFASATDQPECVAGVVDVREEMLPVVDLAKILASPLDEITEETRYLVLPGRSGKVACVVDQVGRIVQVEDDQVQEFPKLVSTDATGYVDYVAKDAGGLVIVIQPQHLLADDQWQQVQDMLKNLEEKDD